MRILALVMLLVGICLTANLQAQEDEVNLGQDREANPSENTSLLDNEPLAVQKTAIEQIQNESAKPLDLSNTRVEREDTASVKTLDRIGSERRNPGKIFGFGLTQVNSLGEYNHYSYLYGKKSSMGHFYAGYYFGSLLFDFGIVSRFGYYNATGHPLERLDSPIKKINYNLTTEAIDSNQKLELTLIPVQATLELGLAPFKSRWLVLRAWFGGEGLYVQELLEPNLPSGKTDTNTVVYANTGWNYGLVTGGMISISLTGIEPRTDYSLKSLGIDRIYISPFFEIVKTLQAKMGNFDRKNYGLAFSFEGLR